MRRLPSLDHVDVAGMRVLIRADLNLPMRDGVITDSSRLERLIPTLRSLMGRGARIIVMSHLGRPKKRDISHSLAPIARAMEKELGKPICFAPDCVGAAAQAEVDRLEGGSVALLENLRFHPEEESNDKGFAQQLAALADYYVNDAFSCSHRAHASVHAIAWNLPAFAGPSLLAEIDALGAALVAPEKPVIAIVGGSKVSSKLAVLENLVGKVNFLAIGGGMANTFLTARGYAVGRSLQETSLLDVARSIEQCAAQTGCQIILPCDAIVAPRLEAGAPTRTVSIDDVPADEMILDVGPRSVAELCARMAECRTILWNGPLGAFEVEPFGAGTFVAACFASDLTKRLNICSIAGGGDTVAALNAADAAQGFTYISTAGGAFLEWLEGKKLPGIAALAAQISREKQ